MIWSFGGWTRLSPQKAKTAAAPTGKIATEGKSRANKKDF